MGPHTNADTTHKHSPYAALQHTAQFGPNPYPNQPPRPPPPLAVAPAIAGKMRAPTVVSNTHTLTAVRATQPSAATMHGILSVHPPAQKFYKARRAEYVLLFIT